MTVDDWVRRITHAVYVDDAQMGHMASLLRDMWVDAYNQGVTKMAEGARKALNDIKRDYGLED